jgi:hypothetical protein
MANLEYYDFDPRNLPQDLLAAMGLMTTCAAYTESCVDEAIAGCLGVDYEYGQAVTTHMTIPLRFNVLKSAAEIRIDDLDALDELDVLLDRLDEAFNKRNAVVHHIWGRDPETGNVVMVKETARGRVEIEPIPMSADQVKSDALFVYDAGIALFLFLKAHNLVPPLPTAPRPRWHKSKEERKKRRERKLKASS